MTETDQILLADIGGTNARFALLGHGRIGPVEHLRVADYPAAADALAAFLKRYAQGAAGSAVLGVAGPIENNRAVLTNSPWIIDADQLRQVFGLKAVHLLNDFEALAWSLPGLESSDLFPLGGRHRSVGAPMLVVGPGTGFGASCLVPSGTLPLAIVTEAGHATLPALCEREEQVIGNMRRRFGHVSIEHALSGSGLEHLYHAINVVEGARAPDRDAASITQAALDRSCNTCRAALDIFCGMLGTVCGNLALTFAARGGVYIAGGIVPRFVDYLARSDFRRRFESKGGFAPYLRDIPVNIVTRADASFVGLKAFSETKA
jgi:glucokinase